jgi:hypothetical protein
MIAALLNRLLIDFKTQIGFLYPPSAVVTHLLETQPMAGSLEVAAYLRVAAYAIAFFEWVSPLPQLTWRAEY